MQHGSETRESENPAASVTSELLDDVVRRIVESVHPRRIILFGSAACGTMGRDSDLDLLVVMPDGTHRRHAATDIFRALRGVGLPKDVVVVTEGDVREYRHNPLLVLKPAFEGGITLYIAA
jgi:predicted nucleotidyltransferase